MNTSQTKSSQPAVCLVHDWLVGMRGGEKVLEAIAELFPEAPIYTLVLDRKKLSPLLQSRKIHTSFLQWIPGITHFYRWLLPLFPIAIRSFSLKQFDLIISSSHCVAKGVRVPEGAVHICYCHTPMRYLWDMGESYLASFPGWFRFLIDAYFKELRKWDVETSRSVHLFIANSQHIAAKILRFYYQKAAVIHPPVESVKAENLKPLTASNHFLIVSALVPYKRIDLAVDAFNDLNEKLIVVGDGPLLEKLKARKKNDKIEFKGWVSSPELIHLYHTAQALIFPGEEDFGIVPVEAQMFGKPVIAFGQGGALETVLAVNDLTRSRRENEATGIFFYKQTPEDLKEAVAAFQRIRFDPAVIRSHAERFEKERFENQIRNIFTSFVEGKQGPEPFVDTPSRSG